MTIYELKNLKFKEGETCVSIILPTPKSVGGINGSLPALRTYLHDVIDILDNEVNKPHLSKKLRKLIAKADYSHPTAGLGFFVSESTEKVIHFFEPVHPFVSVGSSFEVRDIIYDLLHNKPHALLILKNNAARLFIGKNHKFTESKTWLFKDAVKDDFEYPKPHRSGNLVNYSITSGPEKSKIKEARILTLYKKIDEALDSIIQSKCLLLIMGVEENLSLFRKITTHDRQIIGYIPGNYEKRAVKDLSNICRENLEIHFSSEINEAVGLIKEEAGKGLVAWGLKDVENESVLANVRMLLVEKDFIVPEYHRINKSDNPNGLSAKTIPAGDVVDDIIEKVIETGGEVQFTQNGLLKEFNRIAARLRHPVFL